jgi:hypothetical protein
MNHAALLALCLLVSAPSTTTDQTFESVPVVCTAPAAEPLQEAFGTGGSIVITCPETYKAMCDSGLTDPARTGMATAVGGCGPLTITYTDVEVPHPGPDRFLREILRTWTAADACGNSASCTQAIHILRQLWSLDIKPTSCPNPIQLGGGGGQVSIAIVGTAGQDVTTIDPASVRIWRQGGVGRPLAPNMVTLEDVATPLISSTCGCHTLGADGIMDLRLRFDKQQLIQALGLANVPQMTNVRLIVTAGLYGGCELIASDCVRVQ